MCYPFFHKENTLFTTKAHFLNEFSQHYWQESFGDSFLTANHYLTPILSNRGVVPVDVLINGLLHYHTEKMQVNTAK